MTNSKVEATFFGGVKVGFTGTRDGMSTDQWLRFSSLILNYDVIEWHDGDCIGADDQAHKVVKKYSQDVAMFYPKMHGHPCNLHEKFRAHNTFDVMHPIYPPLVRNRIIVDSADLMFAAPKEYDEVKIGSGTWATIRYARRKDVKLIIIWPDGTIKEN